jgi:hypothetical protein
LVDLAKNMGPGSIATWESRGEDRNARWISHMCFEAHCSGLPLSDRPLRRNYHVDCDIYHTPRGRLALSFRTIPLPFFPLTCSAWFRPGFVGPGCRSSKCGEPRTMSSTCLRARSRAISGPQRQIHVMSRRLWLVRQDTRWVA